MNAPDVVRRSSRSAPAAPLVVAAAAGEARRPSLALLGWGASGAAHAAMLAAACYWGASAARFQTPPPGASAISLRAARAIVVEPITAEESNPSSSFTASADSAGPAGGQALRARTIAVARIGELPPTTGPGEHSAAASRADAAATPLPDVARAARDERPTPPSQPTPLNTERRATQLEAARQLASQVDADADSTTTMTAATGVDAPPRPLSAANPSPVYPREAYLQRIEGLVVVRAKISSQGSVAEAQVRTSSGYAMLDHEALRAVRQWRFEPALRGGIAVSQTVDLPIRFYLEE